MTGTNHVPSEIVMVCWLTSQQRPIYFYAWRVKCTLSYLLYNFLVDEMTCKSCTAKPDGAVLDTACTATTDATVKGSNGKGTTIGAGSMVTPHLRMALALIMVVMTLAF